MVGPWAIAKDCLTIGMRREYLVLSPRACYLVGLYSGWARLDILLRRLYDEIPCWIIFKDFEMPWIFPSPKACLKIQSLTLLIVLNKPSLLTDPVHIVLELGKWSILSSIATRWIWFMSCKKNKPWTKEKVKIFSYYMTMLRPTAVLDSWRYLAQPQEYHRAIV